MNIFLSWSGARSRLVAEAFKRCLEAIFEKPEIYLSASMNKGIRWNAALNRALDEADFAILCVTKDNYSAPWLIYEAGILSRTAGENRVAPFLLDIRAPKFQGPVTEFQLTVFDKRDLKNLISTINQCHAESERIRENVLAERFEMVYNSFLERLLQEALILPEENTAEDMARKTLAGVERLLDASRANQRLLKDIIFDMKERQR